MFAEAIELSHALDTNAILMVVEKYESTIVFSIIACFTTKCGHNSVFYIFAGSQQDKHVYLDACTLQDSQDLQSVPEL